jgi:redox-sensitive bicupin YhaK (pirin superfamily)
VQDSAQRQTEIVVVAGHFGSKQAPAPPPKSWAARTDTDVAIWTIKMAPEARFDLPPAQPGSSRTIYFFRGSSMRVGDQSISRNCRVLLRPDVEAPLIGGPDGSDLLLLQGRPIAEPVVQYGPFVMNSRAEIQQAFEDYRRTGFGGWPWSSDGPVLPRAEGRYARHADGHTERIA